MKAGVPHKGPSACEFRLASQVAALLELFCKSEWRYSHLPMGEKRDAATARKLQLMGVTRGWPDYIFVAPGKVCFLELKSPHGGVRSKDQSDIAGHLIACGCGYGLTNNLDDAVAMLQAWGVLPDTIHVQ